MFAVRPWVYIAAPYSHPDPVINTHSVIQFATGLVEDGLVTPIVPHLSLLWHAITPRPIDFWYDYDLRLLARCDAVMRLRGPSVGADAETVEAERLGIPIFKDLNALYQWVHDVDA